MNLHRSGKNNPCPICHRTKDGDCRWYDNQKTILCHTHIDGQNYDPQKWHYNGKKDIWGIYIQKENLPGKTTTTTEYHYPDRTGKPLIKVTRKDLNTGQKNFSQSHWHNQKWTVGTPQNIRKNIPIYNYQAVQTAIQNGETILWVEGEKCVEALRTIGITATTTLGGSSGFYNYGEYDRDLENAQIIICPDRDLIGSKYAAAIAQKFPQNITGYYLCGTRQPWHNLPQNQGIDIADEIQCGNITNLADILETLISPAEYARINTPELTEEQQWEREELTQKIEDLLAYKGQIAPPLFTGRLEQIVQYFSKIYNQPRHVFEFLLLPILGSLISSKTRLTIDPASNFTVPALRWCALVGKSGTMKTPLINRLTKNIKKLQTEAAENHSEALKNYQAEMRAHKNKNDDAPEPASPHMRHYYFNDATIEAIANLIEPHADRGHLLAHDELSLFFNSMDAYRSGKANIDRPKWLSIWDGDRIKTDRKTTGSLYIPQSSISILGAIQPSVLTNIIQEDKSLHDGLWFRFGFCEIEFQTIPAFLHPEPDIDEELDSIYRALDKLSPTSITLHEDCQQIWLKWKTEIDNWVRAHINDNDEFGIAFRQKYLAIAGKNALILHLATNSRNSQGVVPTHIPPATLQRAIDWTRWELSSALGLFHSATSEAALSQEQSKNDRTVKFVDRFLGKGWIGAREVARWWSGRAKPSAADCRSFMDEVVNLGYARTNGESKDSRQYKITIHILGEHQRNFPQVARDSHRIRSDSSDISDKLPQTITQQGLGIVANRSDKLSDISDNVVTNQQANSTIPPSSNPATTNTDSNSTCQKVNFVTTNHPIVTTNVTTGSDKLKPLPSNDYDRLVTSVTTVTTQEEPVAPDRRHPMEIVMSHMGKLCRIESEIWKFLGLQRGMAYFEQPNGKELKIDFEFFIANPPEFLGEGAIS